MEEYTLKIELLTDAVLEAVIQFQGLLMLMFCMMNMDFIYQRKNFKRKTGRNGIGICNILMEIDECREIAEILQKKKEELFGVAEKYSHSKLKFSDCEFSKISKIISSVI